MRAKTGIQLLFTLLLLGSFTFPITAENEEYSIKAAFIYKFTNYIDWASEEVQSSGSDFVIGVVGSSPIYDELNELAKTKTIKGKKIVVKKYNTPEDIGACQILFISRKVTNPLYEILIYAKDKGTLTISEQPGYASLGTQVNFVLVDNKLKFEANPRAMFAAGITASSQLLKLAIIVN
ncbi:MAG: YfiR family protein [Bacteroidota bacterium]